MYKEIKLHKYFLDYNLYLEYIMDSDFGIHENLLSQWMSV